MLKDKSKLKFKAVMMIGLIVVAVLAAVIVFRMATESAPLIEEPALPVFVEESKNYPVAEVPESNNEPCIAVNPLDPNNLAAGGNDYGTPNGDSWCGYYWSEDSGKNWSRDLIPGYPGGPVSVLTGYEGAGDPVVAYDSHGSVYFAGIAFKRINLPLRGIGRQSAIFVAKSTDGGKTYPQVEVVFQAITRASFHDKEWIAVDPETGYVYCVWALFSLYTKSQMLFSRSTDGGQSWSIPYVISDITATEFSVQGAGITVDSEGTIHIIWIDFENQGDEQMRYTRSTDSGSSFAEPKDIARVAPIPREGLDNTNYRTPTLPAIAVDRSGGPYNGYLYATWNDYRNGDADTYTVISSDAGDSWRESQRVNDDAEGNGKDQFFATVCTSPQGYAQYIFYDRRDDPENTMLSVYYAITMDGGETFYQMNITDTSFNGDYSRGPFIGDYISIASSEETAHAIWADTRNGSPDNVNADLYCANIDISKLELK